jgi:hypothetical protein
VRAQAKWDAQEDVDYDFLFDENNGLVGVLPNCIRRSRRGIPNTSMVSFEHPTPGGSLDPPPKRAKISHDTPSPESIVSAFIPGVLEAPSNLNLAYTRSEPYKHCVIDALFNPELLLNVQSEIIGGLSFTEKETDIYKVRSIYTNEGENMP